MFQRTRSASTLSSNSGSSVEKAKSDTNVFAKRKLKAEKRLDTRLLRRVQKGRKPQNVAKLVHKGAVINCMDKVTGERPLHIVSALGHLEMITALLRDVPMCFIYRDLLVVMQPCSSISQVNAVSTAGDTPLHIAARVNNHAAMAALLTSGRGVQVNSPNGLGQTPLHVATLNNSYECWYMLLDASGAIEAKDNEGRTVLHCACASGFSRAISVLANKGTDINRKNKVGNTPLHTAVLANDRLSVEALLALGADVSATNMAGYNALRMAVLFGRLQVIDILTTRPSPRRTAPGADSADTIPRRTRAHTLNISKELIEHPPQPPPREKKKVVYSRSISASNLRADNKDRVRPLPLPPFDIADSRRTQVIEWAAIPSAPLSAK